MLGLIVARYLLELEPLASMPAEQLVAWLAPTIQRYLTGPVPEGGVWQSTHPGSAKVLDGDRSGGKNSTHGE
jgi:hypothetical protein